jgi:hypothetical protein
MDANVDDRVGDCREPVPLDGQRQGRADLIASGALHPGRGSVLGVEPVEAPPGSATTEELLAGLREDLG